MDQVDRAFVPDLLVIPVGSTVEFPNSDSVSHQIYSFSPTKRFQLPLYRGKPYPPVQFDQAGIVTLGCNIHDDMLAYISGDRCAMLRPHQRGRCLDNGGAGGGYRVAISHPRLRGNDANLRERHGRRGRAGAS